MPNGRHWDFRQPELGHWFGDSNTVATDQNSTVLEGWEARAR